MKRLLTAGYAFLAFTLVLEVLLLSAYIYLDHPGFQLALTGAMAWTLGQIAVVKMVHIRKSLPLPSFGRPATAKD